MSAPQARPHLPRVLKPAESRRAARPHPGRDAAGAARPRAVRARVRLRAARGGARQPRPRLGGLRRRGGARRGQGRQDADRAGRRAGAARAHALPGARPAALLADAATSPRCSSPSPGRRLSTSDVRRRLRVWARQPRSRAASPARAAPLLRHPPARRRRRPAGDPGAARSRSHLHDPGLHSGRVGAAASGVRAKPPAGLGIGRGDALETNVKAIELRDLWRRYKAIGIRAAREHLVVAYSPLVKYVAGRMASGLPAHVDEADLISYGLIGLINAIERFDPEREIKFETYAITRIKGAIIDELRSLDWVPRSVRARAREIERVNGKLEHKLQRAPTDEEMAERDGHDRRRVPGGADPDLQLDDRRARRAVDGLRRQRRPGVAARHAARPDAPDPQQLSTRPSSRTASPTRSRACPSARSS